MTTRTIILIGLIYLVLIPLASHAKVDYISLHEIESLARQPLSVRLNIVETLPSNQLNFTLLTQNTETLLEYQRIHNHMLRLKSPHYIIGKAVILVYELEKNAWIQTHSVDISNALIATEIDKKTLVKSARIKTQCLLIHEPKETLWSIASRYKDIWNVDIFSAMLAIYKSNLNKFTNQHIGQLIANAELACPSRKTITMMGEKADMKAEFIRLKQTIISP
jgi:hypothetical protein